MERTIRWTTTAIRQFNAAIEYIRRDSVQNAEKVRLLILAKVDPLRKGRQVHRQDPYKKNNDGSFLYFEIVHYRIVYHVTESEIVIVRLRHTSREPISY